MKPKITKVARILTLAAIGAFVFAMGKRDPGPAYGAVRLELAGESNGRWDVAQRETVSLAHANPPAFESECVRSEQAIPMAVVILGVNGEHTGYITLVYHGLRSVDAAGNSSCPVARHSIRHPVAVTADY